LIRLRKHIAPLLFGIFFFPILFQSVHIVWHHSHNHNHEHHFCHHIDTAKESQTKYESIFKNEESCLICEYKFPINDSPKVFFINSDIPAIACIYDEIDKQQQYKQVFSDKTPRAPPVLIS